MRRHYLALCLLAALAIASCEQPPEWPQLTYTLDAPPLIPLPQNVDTASGEFYIHQQTVLIPAQEALVPLTARLRDLLEHQTGWTLAYAEAARTPANNYIQLRLDTKDTQLGQEGYRLDIQPGHIKLTATAEAGIFYGIQTLHQLLRHDTLQGAARLPAGTIVDYPRYPYRGMMLDVSRHFQQPEVVRTLIDRLAAYKINHLHLHLSDDQGWRIEIKSRPRLTEIGATTQVGGGPGGYYTQEQYKELVAYAADHFITIVPEIDMPGHTNAALTAYPEINCDDQLREPYTGMKVGFSTLCTRRDTTYAFVRDVLEELAAMTPGPYLHIGGDESHVTAADDYVYFIERVQQIVRDQGKQMIGWDEIGQARLLPGTIAQHWARPDNARRVAQQDRQLIYSPSRHAYLDMQYDSTTHIGLHWAGYVEVDQAYDWAPDQLIEGVSDRHILGVEGPLWTETVTNEDELEYLAFPRIIGLAEIGWSAASARNWPDYRQRLAQHGPWLNDQGIHFYRSALVPWSGPSLPAGKK